MTRLIDADEFFKNYPELDIEPYNNAPTFEITEEQAIDKLHETGWLIEHDKEMTERPHGKWIYIKKEDKQKGYGGYCSICKCDMPIGIEDWKQKYYESNFCPYCGEDVRKEADNGTNQHI